MSDTDTVPESQANDDAGYVAPVLDSDPAETKEWMDSLEYILKTKGPERAKFLLSALESEAMEKGVELPHPLNTPYINTLPPSSQNRYPGNREIERRIKSIIRWNAMAMVARANNVDPIGSADTSRHLLRPPPCTKLLSITSSAAVANRASTAIKSTSKAMLRPACTRAPFSKVASPKRTWTTSVANCSPSKASLRIRILG